MIISSARPKARKRHRCEFCTGPIQPGEHYHRKTDVTDGRMSSFKVCEPCDDMTWEVWMYFEMKYDEGVSTDDFRDWAIENLEREEATYFLARLNDRGAS